MALCHFTRTQTCCGEPNNWNNITPKLSDDLLVCRSDLTESPEQWCAHRSSIRLNKVLWHPHMSNHWWHILHTIPIHQKWIHRSRVAVHLLLSQRACATVQWTCTALKRSTTAVRGSSNVYICWNPNLTNGIRVNRRPPPKACCA